MTNNKIVIDTICSAIDDVAIKSDWHYAYGLIDMALVMDKIDIDKAREFRHALDKKLCELDRED